MGLIYVDSCVLIYALENSPQFGDAALKALEGLGDSEFAISSLTKMECLVHPFMANNLLLQQRYESTFCVAKNLSMNDDVFLNAARLRAQFRIATPDALHLSCAQLYGCSALWTNDNRLVTAGSGLAINIFQ